MRNTYIDITIHNSITMEGITAENHALLSLQEVEREEEEEEPHRLSFRHLPMPQTSSGSSTPHTPKTPSDFDFSAAHPAAAHSYHNDIVFCGKIIHDDDDDEEEGDDLNEYQKRDYFATVRSKSLRKPSSPESNHRRLSASTRFSGELARPKCAADLDYHVQRVNISSLTSMSAKSRRRMFMFGPVKFKPEMELGAIKQRQAKLASAEKAAAEGGDGGWKGQWGMLKSSLKGRSHLTSVLARSLGCIPVAGGGVGRLGAAS